jgi:hypothetical protein
MSITPYSTNVMSCQKLLKEHSILRIAREKTPSAFFIVAVAWDDGSNALNQVRRQRLEGSAADHIFRHCVLANNYITELKGNIIFYLVC